VLLVQNRSSAEAIKDLPDSVGLYDDTDRLLTRSWAVQDADEDTHR
jgi:hypothetical protein